MISSGSVGPSTRRPATRPALAVGVAVFAALSATGLGAGCERSGGGDSTLLLALQPDASCSAAPLACVNQLHVLLLEEDGAPWQEWTLPFAVPDGEAPLGPVPDSGDGRFVVTGRAVLGTSFVPLFTGSANVSLTGSDQRVVVPVTCGSVPDPC